jgi:hypothetical protein
MRYALLLAPLACLLSATMLLIGSRKLEADERRKSVVWR